MIGYLDVVSDRGHQKRYACGRECKGCDHVLGFQDMRWKGLAIRGADVALVDGIRRGEKTNTHGVTILNKEAIR